MIRELAMPMTDNCNVPIVCISTAYFGNFDGRVWKSEMIYDKAVKTFHLDNSRHGGYQMIDRRMKEFVSSGNNV